MKFAAILASALMLSACASTQSMQPQVRTETIPVGPPEALLTCRVQPPAPRGEYTQRDVAAYIARLAEAGEDCRSKLSAVKKWADENVSR